MIGLVLALIGLVGCYRVGDGTKKTFLVKMRKSLFSTLERAALGVCGIEWFFHRNLELERWTRDGRLAQAAVQLVMRPYRRLGVSTRDTKDNPLDYG